MIYDVKTIRLVCDHCGKEHDVQSTKEYIIFEDGAAYRGFYFVGAGEHYIGGGQTYKFQFQFCSHECKSHIDEIKSNRIKEIYRKMFLNGVSHENQR